MNYKDKKDILKLSKGNKYEIEFLDRKPFPAKYNVGYNIMHDGVEKIMFAPPKLKEEIDFYFGFWGAMKVREKNKDNPMSAILKVYDWDGYWSYDLVPNFKK